MPRPIGLPKTGGRKKGTPNKETIDLQGALSLQGFDPLNKLLELLPQLSPEKQVGVLMELMGYLFPKRKAIDFIVPSAQPDTRVIVTLPSNGRESQKVSGSIDTMNIPTPKSKS